MSDYRYEIRTKPTNKKPVIAYIKIGKLTAHTLRGDYIEEVEALAEKWIRERTPKLSMKRKRPPKRAKLRDANAS